MNRIFSIATLLVLFFMLQSAGCNNVKELEYKGIQKTALQSIGLKNTAIRIDLAYYNPNKFWLDVKETNLSIYLDDKFIGLADQPEKTKIPRSSDFIFPVVAHFNPIQILGSSFKSLFAKKSMVGIKGTAKVGKGGIYIKVPINITEEVSLLSN